MTQIPLFDTHIHLDAADFRNDYRQVWERARGAGVLYAANAGGFPDSWEQILALGKQLDRFLPCIGIHPMAVNVAEKHDLKRMRQLLRNEKFYAIAEIGLDPLFKGCPLATQEFFFREQLQIALEFSLPVCLHLRKLHHAALAILDEYQPRWQGIAHCFSGSRELADLFVQRGFLISLAGPLTNPNAHKLHRIAREIPRKDLVVETDSPDLPPRHLNVDRNEPAFVIEVVKMLAQVRSETLEQVAWEIYWNACSLFGVTS